MNESLPTSPGNFIPPHSLEAEQSVLGSILIEPDIALPKVRNLIGKWDFWREAHSTIFGMFLTLADAGKPIDLLTVAEELQTRDQLEVCGGRLYLINVMEAPATASSVEQYAQIVREKAGLRKGMEKALQFLQLAERGDVLALESFNGHFNLSEIVHDIRDTRMTAPFRMRQVGEWLTDLGDPPPFLVEELLPQKQLILLAGKPKHLKSFAALDIANSVAMGTPVFGRYPVNIPGPVIYFAMEDSKWSVANRILTRGVKPGDKRPLHLVTERVQVNTPDAVKVLRHEIKEVHPVLIVIDTAAQGIGVKDWSNRSEIEEKMSALRDFAHEDCTVLLVCHNRKAEGQNGDEIAGSNAFTAAVDGWLSATRKEVQPNGNVQVQYHIEGRDIRGGLTVEMDTYTLLFTALTEDDLKEQNKAKRDEESVTRSLDKFRSICRVIATHGGNATMTDVISDLDMSKATVSRLFREAEAAQYIVKAGESATLTAGRKATLYALGPEGLKELNSSHLSQSPMENETNETKLTQDTYNPEAAPLVADFYEEPINMPDPFADGEDE